MAKVKFNVGGVIIEMESEEVSKAIETGEVKLESENLIVKSDDTIIYTKEELQSYEKGIRDDEYSQTKGKTMEMAMKKIRDASGVEIEGYKDPETFAKGFKEKILADANIEPSKKIQELTQDNEKLLGNFQTLESTFETYKTQVTEKEDRFKKDSEIMSYIPTEGLKVDRDITMMALKSKAGIDISYNEEGKTLVLVNGVQQKDEKTLQPIEPKSFITDQIAKLDLMVKPDGGSGGGHETGSGTKAGYDEFVKEMTKAGKGESTEEFNIEMNKRISDGTLKM